MSLAVAFVLAAAAASAEPAVANDEPGHTDRGAQIATAQISVRIVRPAVLKDGKLASGLDAPRSQRHADGTRVIYAFE
jgi:hypothetical protein